MIALLDECAGADERECEEVIDVATETDRALYVAWPPRDSPVAEQLLDAYEGDVLLYAGESVETPRKRRIPRAIGCRRVSDRRQYTDAYTEMKGRLSSLYVTPFESV